MIRSFSYCAVMVNKYPLRERIYIYNTYMGVCVCVCVFECQPTALLRASGSAQGGYLALSVVYFQFTHRLGRPHYVWDEYLYSVQEEVEVRVTACVTVCVV